jgi:hypothetical protein
VGPDAVRFAGDTVFVTAPFPPGGKQVVFSYDLPRDVRQVRLPIVAPTADVEILVDDSGAVAGAGVAEEPALAIEGRSFRRFVARDAAAGAVVEVRLGRRAWFPAREVAIGLAALGLAAGMVLALRRRPGASSPPATASARAPAVTAPSGAATADALLGRLVALDERYADREAETPPAEWAEYQATRAALKARLAQQVAPPST